jgi:DNA replication protein DnaC
MMLRRRRRRRRRTEMSDIKEEIRQCGKLLRVQGLDRCEEVYDESQGFMPNLKSTLDFAIKIRGENSEQRRIKASGLEPIKTLDTLEFNSELTPNMSREKVYELAKCEYIDMGEDVLCFGNNGTGKTHLAKALGLEALRKLYPIRFYTIRDLIGMLNKADIEGRLGDLVNSLCRIRLLIIDDIGSFNIDAASVDRLFDLINKRTEVLSTIYTTNWNLNDWGEFMSKSSTARAIIDRVYFKSHVLDMNSKTSYRVLNSIHAKASKKAKEKKDR